jgi:glucose dehydrogenase
MTTKSAKFLSFGLITAMLLATGLIISYSEHSQLAYAQNEKPSPGESNPKANEKLPSNSLYNQLAEKLINQTSNPQNATLSAPNVSDTGLESKHADDWITTNHDIYYTRSSNQTTINKENVNKLQVKWIFNNENYIENSPLIVGNRVYVLDNGGRVLALDANTGLNLWKVEVGSEATYHGMTYDNGVLFAPTGDKASIVAINATNGKVLWESKPVAPDGIDYQVVNPPIVWKNYVIAGSAGGDRPNDSGKVQGNVTALSRTNGTILWNLRTTVGAWVSPNKVPPNGGGTTWSGGSFDPSTGTLYIPAGNASPDFNATSRPQPNNYTNHMLAIDITTGKLKWATPFVAQGTVIKDALVPDTHDYDTTWGSTLSKIRFVNGTEMTIIIGTDKRGDVMAMDAKDGKPLWWKTLGTLYHDRSIPRVNGSGEVWPGTQYGVEDYHAVDNNNNNGTAYFATSSMGFNFFVNATNPDLGRLIPAINSINNGIGNGTVTAIDIRTGQIKWQAKTDFPTWVSPLTTNGIVFSGFVTPTGKPYTANIFGAAIHTPLEPSGIVLALDNKTGKVLWQFNVGAPIGIGGPSIGHGLLLVPTGTPSETLATKGGSIVAFGLPATNKTSVEIPINVTQGVLPGAEKIPTVTPDAGKPAESQGAASQGQNATATSSTANAGSSKKQS